MKKLLLIALLFLSFFIACKTSGDKHQEQVEKNTANSKEVYHAVETGDVTKLDNFISRDAVDHSEETDSLDRQMFNLSLIELKFVNVTN